LIALALELLRRFLREHPLEAAQALESVSANERADILADEPPDAAVAILRALSPAAAAECLQKMEIRSAVALLTRMPSGPAAQRVIRLSWATQHALLSAMPAPWNDNLERALHAPPHTAGAVMSRHVPALPESLTVGVAIAHLEARPGQLAFEIFVVDGLGRLVGRTDLAEVHKSPVLRPLSALMQPKPASIALRSPVRSLPHDSLWRRFDTLPVVDPSGLLMGAVSHRALRALSDHREQPPTMLASPLVDAGELVWSGYAAAIDVAAAVLNQPENDDGA
jgi:magnesium transporter